MWHGFNIPGDFHLVYYSSTALLTSLLISWGSGPLILYWDMGIISTINILPVGTNASFTAYCFFVIFLIVFADDWKRMLALLISMKLRGMRKKKKKKNRLACGYTFEFIAYLLLHLDYTWEGELVCNLWQSISCFVPCIILPADCSI